MPKDLRKKRYNVEYFNHIIEPYIFTKELDGLIIAEIEFNSYDDANAFIPPPWFSYEVTNISSLKCKFNKYEK